MLRINRLSIVTALGCMVGVVPSSAFVALGHGRLIGTATARAEYDSNVFVNSSEVDDYVGSLTGGLRFVQNASVLKLDAGVGITLMSFADDDNLNSADPSADALLTYAPSDKTYFKGSISLRRNTIGNEALNDRTKSNDFQVDGEFEHLTTEKIGFRLNAGYSSSNYLTTGYSDVNNFSLGANAVYEYSPKLKLLGGIATREWWTDNRAVGRASPASQDWRFTVGAEGELAAKVTGELSGGLVRREASSGFSDRDAFYLSSSVTWAAAEKTSIGLKADQDFSVSAADQSVKSFSIGLSLNQGLSEKLSFDAYAGIDRSNYQAFNNRGNREDDGYSLRGRFGYAFADDMTFEVSAGFRHNDSNQAVATYDRFSFGVGASVRF